MKRKFLNDQLILNDTTEMSMVNRIRRRTSYATTHLARREAPLLAKIISGITCETITRKILGP